MTDKQLLLAVIGCGRSQLPPHVQHHHIPVFDGIGTAAQPARDGRESCTNTEHAASAKIRKCGNEVCVLATAAVRCWKCSDRGASVLEKG